jgi:hypothetical protein
MTEHKRCGESPNQQHVAATMIQNFIQKNITTLPPFGISVTVEVDRGLLFTKR